MALSLRVAGAIRNVSAVKLLAGGSLRPAKTLKMMRGNGLVTVATFGPQAGPLVATASQLMIFGDAGGNRPATVTSDTVTVTPAGGISPYSYLWSLVSGSAMGIVGQGTASARFRATLFNSTITATYRCTVTDANGASATCEVAVQLSHEGYADGPIP